MSDRRGYRYKRTHSNGESALPTGGLKLTEIKGSTGYTISADSIYFSIIADKTTGTKVTSATANGTRVKDLTSGDFEVYTTLDTSSFGSLSVDVIDAETGTTPQGAGTFQGAKFQVVNNSAHFVKVGGFPLTKPGEVCYEFTTDENGHFESENIFPIGSYLVTEVEAPEGYEVNTEWSKEFSITYRDKEFSFASKESGACENSPICGSVEITLQDSFMADETPETALFEGVSFSVLSDNDNPVVVDGTTFNRGDVVLTLTARWNGEKWVASCENILPYGDYTLKQNTNSGGFANDYYAGNGMINNIYVRDTSVFDRPSKRESGSSAI